MKKALYRLTSLLLVSAVLFLFASCEVEMEPFDNFLFINSVEATVWQNGATAENETESVPLSSSELESGTPPMSFVGLTVSLDPRSYNGYHLLSCDFTLTASKDVKLVLEPSFYVGENGEARSADEQTVSLAAGEATSVSISFEINLDNIEEELFLKIAFLSALPFEPPAEGEENAEYIELADWAAIAYEIGGLQFYGAQTTAN